MRDYLIRLAIKYQGDYGQILRAIKRNEAVSKGIALQKAITIIDQDYPKSLLMLKNPPFVLFYQGNIDLLKCDAIAVIGSRDISEYGSKATIEVVNLLKQHFCIISGLAKGVDSLALLYAEKSIAVIGNGINVCYPLANTDLYSYMREKQLIISEYPQDVNPLKRSFPFRNRIIAALAKSIVVTQAAVKSGTMITVNEALNLNKEIYCVPYRYDDEKGQGCNQLIQQGANIFLLDNLNDIFDK
ncbi:MAG: DNA-processing protein DprA [Erysipelotrichaceae bacterium]